VVPRSERPGRRLPTAPARLPLPRTPHLLPVPRPRAQRRSRQGRARAGPERPRTRARRARIGDVVIDTSRRLQSVSVPAEDGVRLAVDVWLPVERTAAGRPVGTVMRVTRYYRAEAPREPGPGPAGRRCRRARTAASSSSSPGTWNATASPPGRAPWPSAPSVRTRGRPSPPGRPRVPERSGGTCGRRVRVTAWRGRRARPGA